MAGEWPAQISNVPDPATPIAAIQQPQTSLCDVSSPALLAYQTGEVEHVLSRKSDIKDPGCTKVNQLTGRARR